jgi:hypothetical protein
MDKWEVVELIKEIAADIVIIAYGGFFSWVFIWVLLHGSMHIVETNIYILWIEVVVAPMLVVLGIERLIKDIKKNDKGNRIS